MTSEQPPSWLSLFTSDGTPRRAVWTSVVVGTLLCAINHGDTLLSGAQPPWPKLILTYCVPYCVASWGAATAKRAAWIAAHPRQ